MDFLLIFPQPFRVPRGLLALLLFPLLLEGCSSVTAPVLTSWEGTLAPILPHTLGGRVAALTQFGRTQATIQIEEGEPEVSYGWRIEAGTCQEAGMVQGGAAAYPPLIPSEGGTAAAETTLSEIFKSGGHFAVKVFLSSGGGGEVIVACGELVQVQ